MTKRLRKAEAELVEAEAALVKAEAALATALEDAADRVHKPCRHFCNLDRSQDRCWNCGKNASAHGLNYRVHVWCGRYLCLDQSQDRCGNCQATRADHRWPDLTDRVVDTTRNRV